MTTTHTPTHCTPWYLAEVLDAAGSADPSFQPLRHVYVRMRAGLVDVRGAGGVYVRLTVGQAAARLRTVRDAAGGKTLVKGQARYDREHDAFWRTWRELRHGTPRRAA
jgi:hypothetical protein